MIDAAAVLARDMRRTDKRRARKVAARECGECRACCEMKGRRPYVPLPEVSGACPALGEAGCTIYAQRPGTCRQYLCGWRAGLGAEGDRPDKSGWLLDVVKDGTHHAQPMFLVRFIATGPHGTMEKRAEVAQRAGAWLRSLPAEQVSGVETRPWRDA